MKFKLCNFGLYILIGNCAGFRTSWKVLDFSPLIFQALASPGK